MEINY